MSVKTSQRVQKITKFVLTLSDLIVVIVKRDTRKIMITTVNSMLKVRIDLKVIEFEIKNRKKKATVYFFKILTRFFSVKGYPL